ncbi:unannotated protein [freshwater metagenome]|uniref:Unannotated protein n=1 Tax=freshwater metagenome TaxID=449393 RepID=A0A6J7CJE2_9ZZZZ
MDGLAFEHHLLSPEGLGAIPEVTHQGSAGGVACGDLIQFRVEVSSGTVAAGFDAEGCGALTACGSAIVARVSGLPLLEAAKVGLVEVAEELGGLSASKVHASELAVDAFHRALGAAARDAEPLARSDRRLVAMSGGVDSAVAAWLASEDGTRDVAAVTLELWRDEESDAEASCCSHIAVRRARDMAHTLGLPHLTLDLREEFRAGVVDPWIDGYRNGATPNPCVQCNGNVRIEPMVDLADSIGAEALVTGHYARFSDDAADGLEPLLREGVDPAKDQAYALARVPREVLARMEFPLGGMHKPEVRDIARKAGLEAAETADSQDLCFLAGVGREAFLARHGGVKTNEGPVVDQEGRRVGTHRGIHNHTVGQRKGLGIGGGEPLYVLRTDSKSNTVTVAPRAAISTLRVELVDLDLRADATRVTSARLRHHGATGDASLELGDDGAAVLTFAQPAVAVAPGQMACLLEGDLIVGCATISGAGA